ncbi:hypothetical protein P7C71_g4584, partial [Lecanoromycetidae sp. Uapishka_2]
MEDGIADEKGTDVESLKNALASSSTKQRVGSLATLQQKLIIGFLFETYPYYNDRSSRRRVQVCFEAILDNPRYTTAVSDIVKRFCNEASKQGLAPSSAFVLLELGSILLSRRWEQYGRQLALAIATLLDLCASSGKGSVKQSALMVTKRAIRHVYGDATIGVLVTQLAAKEQPLGNRTATLLGVVAGVCARKSKETLTEHIPQYYSFYNREILGSRQIVPRHIAHALDDFFFTYATSADLGKEIVPAFEKSLLRSPEVATDLLPVVVQSLPEGIDLAQVLAENLLKPLLSNANSKNPDIRNATLVAFSTLAERSRKEVYLDKAAQEIATLLCKTSIIEQRSVYARMLTFLPNLTSKSEGVLLALCQVAGKEPHEAALEVEVSALTMQFSKIPLSLVARANTTKTMTDTFCKGLIDKKPGVRRIWALGVGDVIWRFRDDRSKLEKDDHQVHIKPYRDVGQAKRSAQTNGFARASQSPEVCRQDSTVIAEFLEKIATKLVQIFDEVIQSSLTAGPLAAAAFAVTALGPEMLNRIGREEVKATIRKAKIQDRALSTLFNHRLYTRMISEDLKWVVRALSACSNEAWRISSLPSSQTSEAWAQAFIYMITAVGVPFHIRQEATALLTRVYLGQRDLTSKIIISGLWSWHQSLETMEKDTPALAAKTGTSRLHLVLRAICCPKDSKASDVLQSQLVNMLVLCRQEILPRVHWIEMCLRAGEDPGEIVQTHTDASLSKIESCMTSHHNHKSSAIVDLAACNTAAELAFIAPDAIIPRLLERIATYLPADKVAMCGPTEIAIARTPEGTAFVDVLSTKGQAYAVDKSSKDYDLIRWEEEIRSQIAQKKGQQKKLTTDEKAKVNTQLAKESTIREEVHKLERTIRDGVGFIQALAVGPPTDAGMWLGPSLKALTRVIAAGAGKLVGHAADDAFLACSKFMSMRLGSLREFIGIATLRALGSSTLPKELTEEPLGKLVTRLLYRLRSTSEQRPFDSVSLIYMLPLVLLVLSQGGIAQAEADEADEQVTLALEILSYHTEKFSDKSLPRDEVLTLLVQSMQRFSQHYKLVKDCLSDTCRAIGDNASPGEVLILLGGTIVPQISVRTAMLQAIREDIDLTDSDFSMEIWLACHDDVQENVDLGHAIWQENALEVEASQAINILPYLASKDRQLRRSASRALAESIGQDREVFGQVLGLLEDEYRNLAKPRIPERDAFGMPKKIDLTDPWENRSGIAEAFKATSSIFDPFKLVEFIEFLIQDSAVGDRNPAVRDEMIDSATAIIGLHGATKLEELMQLFEVALDKSDTKSTSSDLVNEAVVILYGALASHLEEGDKRVPKVVQRLLMTLDTPSETVQYAVAGCLPPLIQTSGKETSDYVQIVLDKLLQSKQYATRRGAAYGLASIVRGKGISSLREYRIMSSLKSAIENKKDLSHRQGALFAYELLALLLGRSFEPYIIQIVPQLLGSFGDATADVREACLDASKTCFASLSSYGVKIILPTLLEGLEESQWRSKKGACDLLGAMAYLDPQQLALSLPDIIPPLTGVLNDSHKEVRASANRSLQRFGEVISNPEVKGLVNILLKALSDPTKYTDEALDALIKVSFVHYLDSPSLALIVRILERALGERSASKRKSAQIIGSLAHLTERKDVTPHLPILVTGLKLAIVDPVPATRATASKALGSLVEKLGEDALPDLIPSLMSTLKSDTGAGDRLGSAQALSEVLAGLGTGRLEETLPTILQNVASSKATVREGFMSLFIYLPACFGNSFASYLSKIIPPILSGLADEVESIRETSLRAGRLLVKNFATKAIDLLLPELDRGLADDSYRIRLSSVELVGDLLFNLTGISGKTEQDEDLEGATEAGQSLLEVLGEDKRNKILSSLYICRCDTSGLVKNAATNVWKALVATPRTLKELVPILTQLLIRRLASSNLEQKAIAGAALGELIRKAGEGVLASLLPTLEEGLLSSTDTDNKQGICIALREIIFSASPEALEDYEKTLISVVRIALVDADDEVRETAAEAFDSLQRILGKKAVDQVLPYLLNLLRQEDEADTALSALLTLLTDNTRSNIILPNLVPTLLVSPITHFNAKAIASLSEVAGPAMTRRLPAIFNALMDNIIVCKDDVLRSDLEDSFDAILLSVDEYDGLNTAMSVMLSLVKHNDHRKRAVANLRLSNFFAKTDVDFARYHQDLIRVCLISFDDSDADVVKAAWLALSELTKRLKKEEMEALVLSTRQILQQVGVPGASLPGFLLPKGINAVLPIFLQGLMNGTADQRTNAALAISDIVDRTNADSLKPFVTQITGPLIRVVSERSPDVKSAILLTLNNLLEKIPTFLKPFLPQLQRTFAKSLADPTSEVLRSRAAKALGTLITLTPRIDPLIAELVTGSRTQDSGVQNAMLKALYEVVSKAGTNMSEASRSSILGLIDSDTSSADESPTTLADNHVQQTTTIICHGIRSKDAFIADNSVLAAGKYLLNSEKDSNPEALQAIIEALAAATASDSVDTRRLALVVIRTLSRTNIDLIHANLSILALPIYKSVKAAVIPVKLAAEAALLAIFSVVDNEREIFDRYIAKFGSSLETSDKRGMQMYFERVTIKLGAQARERKAAEGGQGGLGLSDDEREDEREIWSVGKVELGDVFNDE